MRPEQLLAGQFCRVLDQGTRDLDPVLAERLRAARERALYRQCPAPVEDSTTVGAGGTAYLGHRGGDAHPLRSLLAIMAMLIGVSLAYYWNGFLQASENEEVDSALLADELPPAAYLDKGFQAWIEKDSSPGQ